MTNILLTTSATQCDAYLQCKRKWVAGYLLGLKQPQTEPMAFGEVGHKYLEVYQRTGVLPDENKPWQFTKNSKVRYPGKSARKALKHIPAPKTGRPEHGFKFNVRGIEFIGYIDLEWQDSKGLWVTDYKFVSSFQSALAEDTLAANIQATIYATKALLEHKVKEVNLKWIYILSTQKPSARPIITKLTEEQTKKQLQSLLGICREMIQLKEHVNSKYGNNLKEIPEEIKNDIINPIEPTVESCSRYNGCYYCDRCQLTEEQLLEGDMTDMDKNLESKLKDMGLDQFLDKEPVQEPTPKQEQKNEVVEAIKETYEKAGLEKKQTTNNKQHKQLDINDFLTKPETHTDKPKEKREEPKVNLNAPEHYVEDTKTMDLSQLQKELDKEVEKKKPLVVGTSCGKHFSLTDEEKKVLKGIIDRM